MLEKILQKATMVVRGQEHMYHQKNLRKLVLFSPV